jgi:SHS2 domain-containing protein
MGQGSWVKGQSPVQKKFETFEHEADIGIRGFGTSLQEAFENAAIALYSVMVKIEAIDPIEKREITVSAPDQELLFIEWLNALLSLSDIERMFFSKFSVQIDGTSLRGVAWGEGLNRKRHKPKVEVKGATYHLLSVTENCGTYTAQCVVDV